MSSLRRYTAEETANGDNRNGNDNNEGSDESNEPETDSGDELFLDSAEDDEISIGSDYDHDKNEKSECASLFGKKGYK